MAERIYALAKELKLDSKELVEVCNKCGITGKGSALASLSDEEVVKVKAYLAGPKPSAKPVERAEAAAAPMRATEDTAVLTRDDYKPRAPSKIRVIRSKPAADAEPTAEPTAEATPPPPAADEATPIPKPAPLPEVPEPAPVAETPVQKPVVDPLAPKRPPKQAAAKKKEQAPPKRPRPAKKKREPVINLAALPEVKQPATPKKEESKAQKPEVRLPADAIAALKRGKGALSVHISKAEAQARAASETAPGTEEGRSKRGKRGEKKSNEPGSGRGLGNMATLRQDRQKQRKNRRVRMDDGDQHSRGRRTLRRTGRDTAAPRKGKVVLELPCTVRTFSEAAGVPASRIQKVLMGMGTMLTINSVMEDELTQMVAAELDLDFEFKQQQSLEDAVITELETVEDTDDQLLPRPPVVTFLGHVDHGKTSLLDYLIGTQVADGEAGGITQHIRAYQVEKDDRTVSFVDTPGHEAFTEMRARGANVTDIAVLVIAADDGIMPQTEEAISHAKAAEVPIVVALNKIDLPGADPNRVMTQMTEYELTPSEWGGDIEVVKTSALTGDGMDELLETLLTIADLHEFQANPDRAATGTCLEAEQDVGRGVIAKCIVKNGTLKVGDIIVCGTSHGRVKAMYDTLNARKKLESAGPSVPVSVTGLDAPPDAGETFYVLDDIVKAREIADTRSDRYREQGLAGTTTKVSFEIFQQRMQEGRLSPDDVATLNLIVRADMRGSIEAIQKELDKFAHPEVQVKVLQASVGAISVADVTLAYASGAVILGFNVIPDEAARGLADERNVEIRRYDVIYKLSDDIKALLEGKLKPEEKVIDLGHAIVKQVFPISRVGTVAGCYVARGSIERNCRIRVNRDGRTIGDYALESLRREKEDVREVPRGLECGMKLAGFNDIKQDDVLEAYKIEEIARTL